MKYLLMAAILLSISGSTLAQEDGKAKRDAYYLCVNHIEKDPHKAYEYCSDYLNKYANDGEKLIDFPEKFVTAYKKISQYLKSVPMTYFAEKTTGWALYSPGLVATIPSGESRHAKYTILVKRDTVRLMRKSSLPKQSRFTKTPIQLNSNY